MFGGIIYMGLYCQYDILQNSAFNYKGVEIPKEIDIRTGESKYMSGYRGADIQCWLFYASNK